MILNYSTANGKPTINPENNLLAAPGSIHSIPQNKQIRPTQTNGHPHMVSAKYAPGEVLVGQSPRLATLDGQQLQSSSSSVVHDHPSGARPSTSSTISSDHFSSDYFSSNNSHELKQNEQLNQMPLGYCKAGLLPLQEALIGNTQQRGEICPSTTDPILITAQKPISQTQNIPHPTAKGKLPLHYISPNIVQYQHNEEHHCGQNDQFECQQRAAAKLCEHLSQNYDSRDHSRENSNSEYSEDDEEYEEESSERRMIKVASTSQKQSILKSAVRPHERRYYSHHQEPTLRAGRNNEVVIQSEDQPHISKSNETFSGIFKEHRSCQTYYEDQATQTEDEEDDDDICHKHGCRYRRRYQDQTLDGSAGLVGLGKLEMFSIYLGF